MARKSAADLVKDDPAVEEFKAMAVVKNEMAQDVYDAQDDATKKEIDKIVETLQQYVTGNIKVGRRVYPVAPKYVTYTLFYLAVETVKDLALCDIRVANFTFPADMCAMCGGQVG